MSISEDSVSDDSTYHGKPKLLFDVMGTLVHDPFFVEIPEFFGISLETLFAEKHPTAWLDFEHGWIDEAQYFATMFSDQRPFAHEAFREHLKSSYRWLDGMEALMSTLHEQYEIHAFSNYPTWFSYIEETLELSRFLKWSFVSCKMGVRKPEHKMYRQAAKALKVAPEQCIFVDDREENCNAALAVGMSAIRFTNAAECRAALKKLGVA